MQKMLRNLLRISLACLGDKIIFFLHFGNKKLEKNVRDQKIETPENFGNFYFW